MKKTAVNQPKKLKLSRETLRGLEIPDLKTVQGGDTVIPQLDSCLSSCGAIETSCG